MVVVSFVVSVPAQDFNEAKELVKKGINAEQLSLNDRALGYYLDAAEKEPSYHVAYLRAAKIYEKNTDMLMR